MNVPHQYPDLPPNIKNKSLLGAFALFGPGAIVASVTIGSGEMVFSARMGAIFSYSILWVFLLGALFKGLQLYAGARFAILSGKHPLESWANIPGPSKWFVCLMTLGTVVWMPFWLGGGLPKMLGEFTNWIIGIPGLEDPQTFRFYGKIWATLFIGIALILTLIQSYGFLEKLQTILVALFLVSMLFACLVSNPNWLQSLLGMTIPMVKPYEPWIHQNYPNISLRNSWIEILVAVGALGGGTQDYLGYLGILRNKGWGLFHREEKDLTGSITESDSSEENLNRGKAWTFAPLMDVGISFAAVLLFALCFAIMGAALLYPKQEIPSGFNLLTVQLEYLLSAEQPILLQQFLTWLYQTGVFFAFFGTILAAYELYTWTIRECLTALKPAWKTVPLLKFRFWTLLYVGVGGLLLLWFVDKDPVYIVTPAALIGSGLTCGLWCFAMLWSDKKHLPAPLQMKKPLRYALFLAGIFLTLSPSVAFYFFIQNLI